MGILIGIMSSMSQGKSCSIRTLDPKTAIIYSVIPKPLPFKNRDFIQVKGASYSAIENSIAKNSMKNYVIDDISLLLMNAWKDSAKIGSFEKYIVMANDFLHLLETCQNKTDDKTLIFCLAHTELEGKNEYIKWKILGNILREKIQPESLLTYNLMAGQKEGEYGFFTKYENSSVRCPMDFFKPEEEFIPNDLAALEKRIREFEDIELTPKEKEEMANVYTRVKKKN